MLKVFKAKIMSIKVLKIKVLLFIILISTSTSFSQDTISHVVKKGETLYSISKLYDIEISELKKQNNLLTNELLINQKIVFVKNNIVYKDVIEEEDKKTKKEEGFAASIDESIESDKYLALHKSARNGTIIFVKNQMNGNVVIVRVVGKLPNTGNNDKISIRLSSIAFDKLDARDSIIPVELTYVK
jgi:LysM repeat protein